MKATIEKDTANIQTQTLTIEDLVADIAIEIQDKENTDFTAQEKDFIETIDIVERAVGIIEKEMNGRASMVQLKKATNVVEALKAMVDAQSLIAADSKKLTALI